MSLNKSMKNLKYDKRLTEWNITNNQMTREEWNKHLENLPDLANEVAPVALEDDGDEEEMATH